MIKVKIPSTGKDLKFRFQSLNTRFECMQPTATVISRPLTTVSHDSSITPTIIELGN